MNAARIFAKRLRECRQGRGEPLKAMALALGVSEATVSAWERGTRFPSGLHLDAIAGYTGVPIRCLFCAEASDCERNPCKTDA
jgi:transcriptional regulator with XRE-family HTH domain